MSNFNDLLGNDLDLIQESLEDVIRELVGSNFRMCYFERMRGANSNPERIAKFKKRAEELFKLQYNYSDDCEVMKESIKQFRAEAEITVAFELTEYKKDLESIPMASAEELETFSKRERNWTDELFEEDI